MSLENILIQDKNDLSSVKIADFGLSAKYVTSLGSLY
jgi:serine/threonine protein kinase